MKYECYASKFLVDKETNSKKVNENYIVIGIENTPRGCVIAYLINIEDIPNLKNLSDGVVKRVFAKENILGMNYKQAKDFDKYNVKSCSAKEQIDNIDKFLLMCNKSLNFISFKEKEALETLRLNRANVVAGAVYQTITELDEVLENTKGNKLTKINNKILKAKLKRDYAYNLVGLLQDSDFIGAWCQIDKELTSKKECISAKEEVFKKR